MKKTDRLPLSEGSVHDLAARKAISHGPKFQAHFTRASHFTRAILDGDPTCFGQGRTENEALGDMVASHAERFGWLIISGKRS